MTLQVISFIYSCTNRALKHLSRSYFTFCSATITHVSRYIGFNSYLNGNVVSNLVNQMDFPNLPSNSIIASFVTATINTFKKTIKTHQKINRTFNKNLYLMINRSKATIIA